VFNLSKKDHSSYTCILQISAVLHLPGAEFCVTVEEKLCTTALRMLEVSCNEQGALQLDMIFHHLGAPVSR
jgi:hypothetical protein